MRRFAVLPLLALGLAILLGGCIVDPGYGYGPGRGYYNGGGYGGGYGGGWGHRHHERERW
jgi:hypothetical protein